MPLTLTLPVDGDESELWGEIANSAFTAIRNYINSLESSVSSGTAIADGAISESKLDVSNSPADAKILTFLSGHLYWQDKLDASQVNITGTQSDGSIVSFSDGGLAGIAQIGASHLPSDIVSEPKIKISNAPVTGRLNVLRYDGNTDGAFSYDTSLLPISNPDASSGYVLKKRIVGTDHYLEFDPTALNLDGFVRYEATSPLVYGKELIQDYAVLLDPGTIRWTATDTPETGEQYKANHFPELGKAQESAGAPFVYPDQMSFVYKIQETTGQAVKFTESQYFGKAQSSQGAPFEYPAFTAGTWYGKFQKTTGASFQWPAEYIMSDLRLPIQIPVKGSDKQISTGLQHGVPVPLDKTYTGTALKQVTAIIPGKKGITGSTTLNVLKRSFSTIGDSTTRFDITNPSGTTFRYTYDSTGTNPSIADSDASLRVGDWLLINAQNFSAVNNGWFKVTAVSTNYFEVTNTAGLAETDKTIGTGGIYPIRKLLSSDLSLGDVWSAESTSFISSRNSLTANDVMFIDISAIHTTAPYGLLVSIRTGGINVSD